LILVDGHLDLAFNWVCFGRDPRRSALEHREREGDLAKERWRGRCMTGRAEMRQGRVAVVFPTIFLVPRKLGYAPGDSSQVLYDDAKEAHRFGKVQLDRYRELHDDPGSGFRMVGNRADLKEVLAGWDGDASGDIGMVPLLEGADPLRDPEELAEWKEAGLRIVGLAWRGTRYSGGTGEPGPLTALGRRLVPAVAEQGLILDLSHASEEAFFEALELSDGAVIASHSNPRAMRDTDRQLSDRMIRSLAERDAVIGCVPFNLMLVEGWEESGKPSVPLARVAEAMEHTAEVAGRHDVVAIGSDFDGGFGAEAAPEGLETIADLPRLADALADRGFADGQIRDMLGGNWIRFLERTLPAS
jgi:membrane dipeptidase